jgi:hypothetical protein
VPERHLTWHAASILPYASLWHTVLRACSLNALHVKDLPHSGGRHPAVVELIVNVAPGVDVTAFAHELGESSDAFRWSTLGALPLWLRCAVTLHCPRVCLACLNTGYHSALFSINLLDECPIHGRPLVSRCHCGAPFEATLRRAPDYGTAGSCRCGRLHFFTRETCRRPTLPVAATDALEPVATWLESCCTLIRPRLLEEALMQHAAGSLYWLAVSAQALGVPWPSCFRPLRPAPLFLQTTVHQCTKPERFLSAGRIQSPSEAQPPRICGFWNNTPEVVVYRALARHIRRHIALHSTRIIRSFVATGDPLEIGCRIQSDVRALRAFMDVLWSRAIEPAVELRRWPDRKPSWDALGGIRPHVMDGCRVQGANANHTQTRWLADHAARVTFGAVWREAALRATLVARTGVADWSDTESYASWSDCAWLARATPIGLHFVTPRTASWIDAPRLSKSERRAVHTRVLEKRLEALLADHSGACLTWSSDTGWTVIDAIRPVDLDLRRRRMLGFTDKRLWLWLYRTRDGRFVARLANARLQAIAATPHAAIAALRCCATTYRCVCHVDLPHAPAAPLANTEPMDMLLADSYHALVAGRRHSDGFWRAAPELAKAARRYQRARVHDSRHL